MTTIRLFAILNMDYYILGGIIMLDFSSEVFYRGECFYAYKYFGAHITDGGVMFRVYAPAARRIELIGEFNGWNGENSAMKNDGRGFYELFVPNACEGQMYKYRVYQANGRIVDKADPYAFASELRPGTASIIASLDKFKFTDSKWINSRTKLYDEPFNIYEIHFGSWKMPNGGITEESKPDELWYNYSEIADELIAYVKEHHFTHIEILPLAEHPFDGSWGYQAAGYFSATSRYGKPQDLMEFINKCHNNGIGVIIDFAFVHFVRDDYAMGMFDGTPLYEYPPSDVNQSEWGSYNFNLSKGEVQSFLMSSAAFWLDIYHFDGIRMDAISNAIYWMGNKDRGINDRALDFVRKMNWNLDNTFRNVILIAEDSTDFPNVTRPVEKGGLGFDYKWDLGWMNDTLEYFKLDPFLRQYHHNKINWSMAYFYNERYLLPLSHDEVVHGKATIVNKMWGLYGEKFSQARSLYTYMFTHPGKKLNFMGNEIAQFREWDETKEPDWFLLEYPSHKGFARFFNDISAVMEAHPAFYKHDYDSSGFLWIDANDNHNNIYSYIRKSEKDAFIVIMNCAPVTHENFPIGTEYPCELTEILNTEWDIYGGCNVRNDKKIKSEDIPYNNFPCTAKVTIPPFGTVIFEVKKINRPVKRMTVKPKTTRK